MIQDIQAIMEKQGLGMDLAQKPGMRRQFQTDRTRGGEAV